MAAKRRSEAVAGGWISREVAQNTAHSGVRIAELVAVILRDQTDGDDDNRQTIESAAELGEIAVHISDTQWKVADGNYPEARRASLSLAAADKGAFP